MRIIFVPQYPTKMRYQEWWLTTFPNEFTQRGFEVITLGEKYIKLREETPHDPEMFSPIKQAIDLESAQMSEYMNLEIKNDDILFLADLSFPGMFANVLYHKKCPKMFAFCHATSINNFDYFSNDKNSKFLTESAHASLFDKVFVGSHYHKRKLVAADYLYSGYNKNWNNIEVTYLPYPSVSMLKLKPAGKTIDIMSASRPTPQKVDIELESKVEKKFNLKIKRPESNTWSDYYWNLSSSKILLITAKEDTFGYQIVDAILNGCIPLARNDFAYPELLPREYLYRDEEELMYKINLILNPDWGYEDLIVPDLLCQEQMSKFYNVISNEMRDNKLAL